jgi:hypothetical protein
MYIGLVLGVRNAPKKSLIFENWSVRKEERAGLRT